MGPANIHDCTMPNGPKVKVVDQVVHTVRRVQVRIIYGIDELLLLLSVFSDHVKRIVIGIVRQRVTLKYTIRNK
jgi:hypothetical protein